MKEFLKIEELSAYNFNYYGDISLNHMPLYTINSENIELYDISKNSLDYSKSVLLTEDKVLSEIFNLNKDEFFDVVFITYFKIGERYLQYFEKTQTLIMAEKESVEDLDESNFFEIVIKDGFVKIRIPTKFVDENDEVEYFNRDIFKYSYIGYDNGLFINSMHEDDPDVNNYKYNFKTIVDHDNSKIILFRDYYGILSYFNGSFEMIPLSSENLNSSIFEIVDLNGVLNQQKIENSFFPLYEDIGEDFKYKYKRNFQYLVPINKNTLPYEKNTNIVTLKNNIPALGNHSLSKYNESFRNYNKIHTGESNIDFDQIYLSFSSDIYSLELPSDKVTYFHVPSDMGEYTQININDTNLSEDGAMGGDSPLNSDKIFKKLYNYGNNTNYGNPKGLLNGKYLCSWFYYNSVEPDKSVWLDRFYSPSSINKLDALKETTYNILNSFYNNVGEEQFTLSSYWESVRIGEFINADIFGDALSSFVFGEFDDEFVIGIIEETIKRVGVFDVKSSMTFEPECLYAYHHIGSESSSIILNKYRDNIISEDFDENGVLDKNGQILYHVKGGDYYSKDISYALDNSHITITFDLIASNPEKIVSEQIIGNYTNESGFGLFKDHPTTPFQYAFKDNSLRVFDYNYNLISNKLIDVGDEINNIGLISPFMSYFVYGKNTKTLYELNQGNVISNRLNLSSYSNILTNTPYSIELYGGAMHMLADNGKIVWVNSRNNEIYEYDVFNYYDSNSATYITPSFPMNGLHSLSITETHGTLVLLNTYKFEINSKDQIFIYENGEKYLDKYPKGLREFGKTKNLIYFENDGIVDFIIDQFDELYVLTYSGKLYWVDYKSHKVTANFVDTIFENSDKSLNLNYYIKGGVKYDFLDIKNLDDGRIQRYSKNLSKYNTLSSFNTENYYFNNFNSSRVYKYFINKKEFNYRITLENIYDSSDVKNINIPIKFVDLKSSKNKFTLVLNNNKGNISLFLNDTLYYSTEFQRNKYYFNTNILDKPVYCGMSLYNYTPLNNIIGDDAYISSGYSISNFKIYDKALSYYDILCLNRKDVKNKPLVLNLKISNRSYIEEIKKWFVQNKSFRKSEYIDINITTEHLKENEKKMIEFYIRNELKKEMNLNSKIRNINFYIR